MLNKSKIALALSLILSSYFGSAKTLIEYNKVSLTPGLGANSFASQVSKDGEVIAGYTTDENNVSQAVIWRGSDRKMINLGTLKADNSGESFAYAISADSRVVLGESDNDAGYSHAFIWREDDGKMSDLGTLKLDNSGNSLANGISADGRVVIGDADNDAGNSHGFIWRNGDQKVTSLGTLKSDNSGNSRANGISADGSVVVGSADNDAGDSHAFIWRDGDQKVTSLGTLKSDNSGNSRANGISADGSVVVGSADNDEGQYHAFIWRNGDQKVTSLGTLTMDNSGSSLASEVSADGSTVVGWAENDAGDSHAFIWREDDGKMTDLGTLKADNSGSSSATGVSADGTVVVGGAETDDGTFHATVWKVKGSSSTIVDATNSSKAMTDTSHRGFKVLDLYQSSLNSLSKSRCQLGQSDYCIGAFTQYDSASSNHRTATGLFGAVRLQAENWIVGGAMNFATSTDLIDNYDTRGSHQPGVGMFIRYHQQHLDNTGFNAELSGAFLQQDLTITRDQLANTEAGQGNSRIKGYQVNLSARYDFDVTPSTLVSPEVALTHHKVTRDGYTETRHAEFAGTYEKMGNTRTDLQLGVNTVHQLNNTIQLDGNIGANVKLYSERDAFVGYIPYIGAYAYDAGDERTVRPFVSAGINVNVTKNSTVRANVGWQQTDYQHDAANVGLGYSYHW